MPYQNGNDAGERHKMIATQIARSRVTDFYIPNQQVNSNLTSVIAIAASCLLVGTGATYPVNSIQNWRQFVQPKVQFGFEAVEVSSTTDTVQPVDVRNIAQHLANIREILSPSMSELAKELGITRQALYKWLSGENQPDDPVKTNFIARLSYVADEFRKAHVSDGKLLIKMKAFNGLSLVDLIKGELDWLEPVQLLINESNAMSAAADIAKFAASKAMPSDGWLSSISIPGTVEG